MKSYSEQSHWDAFHISHLYHYSCAIQNIAKYVGKYALPLFARLSSQIKTWVLLINLNKQQFREGIAKSKMGL